jgi:hypothetical protein
MSASKSSKYGSYKDLASALAAIDKETGIDADTKAGLKKALYEAEYTPSSFNMGEFEGLLGKLEASKMKQQRQKSVEGRRDIMAGGLAGMMNNF